MNLRYEDIRLRHRAKRGNTRPKCGKRYRDTKLRCKVKRGDKRQKTGTQGNGRTKNKKTKV